MVLSTTFLRIKSTIIHIGIIKLKTKAGVEKIFENEKNQFDFTWLSSINKSVIINKKIKKASPNRRSSNLSFVIILLR